MGILEDLRREAREVRAREAASRSAEEARREQARARLEHHLDALYRYFRELAAHLEVVERRVERSYELEGLGRVSGLVQSGYACAAERPERLEGFQFRFVCAGTAHLEQRFGNRELAARRVRELKARGLEARLDEHPSGGVILFVPGRVPAVLAFALDLERERVTLRMRNVDALGEVSFSLAPDRIDRALMDALAELVLGDASHFHALTGNTVPDADREALKTTLEREQSRRRAELRGPLARLLWAIGDRLRHGFRGQ